MPCTNAAKTRNPLKFAGVPQTNETISTASGPKFTILWGHLEDILVLNNFSDCRCVPYLRRYSPTKLCDGAQMTIFGDFFASCISASRAQHVSDLHSKFALGPHHVSKYAMVDIQCPTAEIRRGIKKEEEEDRNHRAKI